MSAFCVAFFVKCNERVMGVETRSAAGKRMSANMLRINVSFYLCQQLGEKLSRNFS